MRCISKTARRLIVSSVAVAIAPLLASAQQVSAPVILQWFESPWKTIDRRTPDLFNAGYGALWTPPPGRAVYLSQGGGIGYDPYDRFDLGKARDATIYGTEGSYKNTVKSVQRMGGNVYVDYVHHHVGSFDLGLNGYTYPQALINQNAPYLQDRSDYPGFEMSDPNNPVGSGGHRDTYAALYGSNQHLVPFGEVYEYWFRLGENLVTVDLASTRSFVRNPVPGNAQNIRQSNANWAIPTATLLSNGQIGNDTKLRQANVPTEDNRRFYPDMDLGGRTVVDRGVSYTVYDFNIANPGAGDPVAETNLGYMQRYAQWMTQVVGVDGLRIDAARHVPLGVYNSGYNPNSLDVPKDIDRATAFGVSNRFNLDGTRRNVFNFQEIFNYDANFLEGFVRKSQQGGDTVNPNRDVLDFSMWKAMAQYMGSNGTTNDWFQIRSASMNAAVFDTSDPNIANNGANGIGFVYNHDEGISPPGTGGTITLDNVAHAWILMRPGNAYVYYRGNEFDRSNNPNFFLKGARGDALGGQFGNILTNLVDVRNSYGRGNFKERWIDNSGNPSAKSAVYVFEREGSAIVGLNVGYNPGAVTRTVNTPFDPGTRLEEATGNWQDPSGQVRRIAVVNGSGQVEIDIPWNNAGNGNKGYVVYGLPLPRGTMSVAQTNNAAFGTFGNETQTPSTNGTSLISTVDVITTNQFKVRMNTNAVTLSDGYRDTLADGDRALFKIDDGRDANGNGVYDYPSSAAANATKYGFEQFLTTNSPGFGSGNGTYEQIVDTTTLSEGYHYVTTRVWRKQGNNENEVFKDFRRALYVDLIAPTVAMNSTGIFPYQADNRSRDIRVKSTDATANSVHMFLDLAANLTEAQILAMVNGTNKSDWIDSDLFGRKFDNVGSGNHVVTTVTYEMTGNKSVQRFVGNYIGTSRGAGLGDVDFDNAYTSGDVTSFETVLYSQDAQFNAASDLNGDGRVNNLDLFGLPARYASVLANGAFNESKNAIRRRGNVNGDGSTNAADIDALFANLGSTTNNWYYDMDVSGTVTLADADILVRVMLNSEYGDTNLDGRINTLDFNNLAGNFGLMSGALWMQGEFNGDHKVDSLDFNIMIANWGFIAPAPASLGAVVPEPAVLSAVIGIFGLAFTRRQRRVRSV